MIKKEINEIRQTLKYTNCSIHKLAGCFIDTEKHIHVVSHDQFLCLAEEEQHKYFDLVKKALSGRVGKNLINLEFETGHTEKRDMLLDVVNSELETDEQVLKLFETIKDNYDYPDNYYIMTFYGVYDVPGKTSDGIEMEDASDEVYKFILTLMCPMKPSKAGLTYNAIENTLENAVRNLMVEPPIHGFLYPSFNNRGTDIHNILMYSKQSEDLDEGLINEVFGCKSPATAKKQSEMFIDAISAIESFTFENAVSLCSAISEKEEESKEDEEKMVIGAVETVNMLEASGVKSEDLEEFKNTLIKATKEGGEILANNILPNTNKLKIKTGITEITLPMEFADGIEVQRIEGRNCLVIEINDELTVNGMKVNKYDFD